MWLWNTSISLNDLKLIFYNIYLQNFDHSQAEKWGFFMNLIRWYVHSFTGQKSVDFVGVIQDKLCIEKAV